MERRRGLIFRIVGVIIEGDQKDYQLLSTPYP